MPRASNNEPRKMTGIKFSEELQSELEECHKAACQRAGVASLPFSNVLNEIVKLGLPLYRKRIGFKPTQAE